MSAPQFRSLSSFRPTNLLGAALIGMVVVLSCSNEDAGSGGGTGGSSSGTGGTPVGGTGEGGSGAKAAGGMSGGAGSGGGSGGASLATGGRGGASGGTTGTGGATGSGGKVGSGGATATGGAAGAAAAGSGGAAGAAAGTGGVGGAAGAGAAAGTGGAGGAPTTCPLPKTFKWTSSGPLATPKGPGGTNWVALKDFTDLVYNGMHIVYMTTADSQSGWGSGMFMFKDWTDASTATQVATPHGVAPTLIHFTPKNTWVLAYQWGATPFNYVTSSDPTNPSSWSSPKSLLVNINGLNPLDQTVICNSTTCYLFYAGDNGSIYRSSMPIGNFPGQFSDHTTVMTDSVANLFEAVEVYAIKGATQYLMIVEAEGANGRYFRSFTATDLGGSWTPLAATESNPFAGKANVTFSGTVWTHDISHGDMVRNNPDETQTVDPCNMQFLYQGLAPGSGGNYALLPYRPGVLTLVH